MPKKQKPVNSDEEWEKVIDFTEIQLEGVEINVILNILSRASRV